MSAPTVLRSGDRVLIRPIREDDKDALLEGLRRLTPESRYRRFFSPMSKLSAAQLRYLTGVDHHTHEALIAIDPSTDEGIGVARFVRSTNCPTDADAAVVVVDAWQHRGVGTALLDALAARAREEGVQRFTASVLASNSPMLELLQTFGVTTVVDGAAGVVDLQIELRDAGIPDGLAHTMRGAARGELTAKPQHPVSPSADFEALTSRPAGFRDALARLAAWLLWPGCHEQRHLVMPTAAPRGAR